MSPRTAAPYAPGLVTYLLMACPRQWLPQASLPARWGMGPAPVATGSCSVFINGFPAARLGDVTGCGAVVATGSCDVYIGS